MGQPPTVGVDKYIKKLPINPNPKSYECVPIKKLSSRKNKR
jgi:hypothetical protein